MRVRTSHEITTTATLTLGETEIRALLALVGGGREGFINTFEHYLGHGILDHQAGITSLFDSIRLVCQPAIDDVDRARKLLAEKKT